MNYIEYGKKNSNVMILLHGGGLSWWNYREVAEKLQSDYHIILPILDGHAESDRDFTTIEDNANEIIEFIDDQFGASVLLMGGLSLGGQILVEILSRRKDICKYAIVECSSRKSRSRYGCYGKHPAFVFQWDLCKYCGGSCL